MDAPPAVEREALERTQRLLRQRTWLMSFGIALCAAPMTFHASGEEVRFLLHRDRPLLAAILYLAGLVCWAGFVWTTRRLTLAGFSRGKERAVRLTWMFGTMAVLLPAVSIISIWTGQPMSLASIGGLAIAGFLAALWAGRATR